MKRKFISHKNLLWILLLAVALPLQAQQVELQKNLARVFKPAQGDTIQAVYIHTAYSDVKVNTWDFPRTVVAVTITVNAPDRDAAKEMMDRISIRFEQDGNTAKATTLINEQSDNFDWINKQSGSYTLHYFIHMPARSSLDVTNDFGTLQAETLQGDLHTHMDYGDINIKSLKHNANVLEGDYAACHLDFLQGGTFKGDFNKIHLAFGFYVKVRGDLNDLHLGRVKSLLVEGDHNKIQATRIKDFTLNGDLQEINIGRIYNARLNGDHNKVYINELGRGFHRVTALGDFSELVIKNPKLIPYRLNIDAENSTWKVSGIGRDDQNRDETTHLHTYFGDSSARSLIRIKGDYLDIEINNPTSY